MNTHIIREFIRSKDGRLGFFPNPYLIQPAHLQALVMISLIGKIVRSPAVYLKVSKLA